MSRIEKAFRLTRAIERGDPVTCTTGQKLIVCQYCDDDGRVETDNNGPIGPGPICNGKKYKIV